MLPEAETWRGKKSDERTENERNRKKSGMHGGFLKRTFEGLREQFSFLTPLLLVFKIPS
jgi:hypothetical protein